MNPQPIRKLGHDIRDYLQQVMATCHLILAQTQEESTKTTIKMLLERSRTNKESFNIQLSDLTPMKTPPLNVMVVEDDALNRDFLCMTLKQQGHKIVAIAENGHEMVNSAMANADINLIVFDIHLPGCDGLCAMEQIRQMGKTLPAVAVTGDKDVDLVDRAMDNHLMGYLIKPIEPVQLLSAIRVAYSSFMEFQAIREEKDTLEATLERRKTIDRAKGILMRRNRWSEDLAFRHIQKVSMDGRMTMIDVARSIIEGKNI